MNIFDVVLGKKRKDKEGISIISLVKEPAIMVNFVKLAEDKESVKMKMSINEDQQIVTGPVLIPNLLIYRSATKEVPEDHFIKFSKEVIRELAEKFLSEELNNQVDLEHNTNKIEKDVKLIEWWITGTPDKSYSLGFEGLPEGSLFCSYKVLNKETWAKVKDDTFNGFSIEANFDLEPIMMKKESHIPESRLAYEKETYEKYKKEIKLIPLDQLDELVEDVKNTLSEYNLAKKKKSTKKIWVSAGGCCKFCDGMNDLVSDDKGVFIYKFGGKTYKFTDTSEVHGTGGDGGCRCGIEDINEDVQ